MSKIYSFYSKKDEEIIEETLYEHINETLNIVRNISEAHISKYVYKMYNNVENFLIIFPRMVNFSLIFHDTGKIFYQYDPLRIQKSLSFLGHEFFSTYIYKEFHNYYYKNERGEFFHIFPYVEKLKIDIEIPIEFSIFYHHHAMDINKRKKFFREKNINIDEGINLLDSFNEELIPFLKEYISFKSFSEFIENLKEKFKENRSNLIASIKAEVEEIEKRIWKTIMEDNKIRRLSYVLLTILLVADNIAAQKKRKYLTDVFHITLNDFYNLYFYK
ncbi:MAG: hypothetical protein QW272_09170 [Candidatus Methanomethylicaceae archaeon]